MDTQRRELLDQLPKHGWHVLPVADHELEWWADEMWLLESTWTPVENHVYLTFLVDPQVSVSRPRKKGEAVWAVMATPVKPVKWQTAEDGLTLSLGQGWKERLPDLLEHLSELRNQAQVKANEK